MVGLRKEGAIVVYVLTYDADKIGSEEVIWRYRELKRVWLG